ncbi:hypothetical protein DSO57_1007025 [Entomophthora muscae]|uniref:Uncharacterized protein n=1 Tax=Entomophthora muscae TaxID=34485 RepID=A0ACC2RM92_9FUNG|nr:hypothetical protein DSO57_1007025 [Entomophthora muscae]
MSNSATCDEGSIYIFQFLFRECSYSWIDGLGVVLGYVSIMCWLNVLFPQIYENYKNKSTESLSYLFLLTWFSGDITNLVGGILTEQQPFQIYLAAYFVIMDIATVSQCIYYGYFYSGSSHAESQYLIPLSNPLPACNTVKRIVQWAAGISGLIFLAKFLMPSSKPDIVPTLADSSLANLGMVISWSCTVLYLGSRAPQIYKNWKRKSVDGLSIHMFLFSFLGNFTYTLSILLRCYQAPELFYNSLPFLLGSAGTMWEDAILFYQFRIYGTLHPAVYAKAPSSPPLQSYSSPSCSSPIGISSEVHHTAVDLPSSLSSEFPLPSSFYSSTPIQLGTHHRKPVKQGPNDSPA